MQTRSKAKDKEKANQNTNSATSTSKSTRKQTRPKQNQPLDLNFQMNQQNEQQFEADNTNAPQVNPPVRPRDGMGDRPGAVPQARNRQGVIPERAVGDYITPTLGNYDSPIYIPAGEGYDFDIKGGLIHMVKSDQFNGHGNPHHHLSNFTEMCRTYRNTGVPEEVVYMKLFPLSLTDKAKDWLSSHEPNSFYTWEGLAQAFIKQYFPPAKVKKIRDRISKFVQFDNEAFYEAYDRFKSLLRDCPHHGFSKWDLLSAFYDGMDENARARMDQVSGGGIMEVTPTEGFQIIEKIARNNHQWGGERNHLKKEEYDRSTSQSDQKYSSKGEFDSLVKTVKNLAQSVDRLNITKRREQSSYDVNEAQEESITPNQIEDLDYIARGYDRPYVPPMQRQDRNVRFQPDSNKSPWNQYNSSPGVQRTPYQNTSQSRSYQTTSNSNPNFNSKPVLEKKPEEPTLTQLMTQMIATQTQQSKDIQFLMNTQQQEIAARRMLETQLAQQAAGPSRNQSKLPSQPDVSSADLNAVTLKSGKILPEPTKKVNNQNKDTETEDKGKGVSTNEEEDTYIAPLAYVPPIPFPQRLVKAKEKASFNRFAEILQKLHVTLPFSEVISQMPTYAKFLKDIITHRRELKELDHVALDANCSAVIQHNMPRKAKDYGSFTIPITVGDCDISDALCDLGAGISIMPYILYEKLEVGKLTPTPLVIRLADRSKRVPYGVLEDMPVKVGDYYIPVDFYVLGMDDNPHAEIPVILGRPFLNTVKALINCGNGTIELNLGQEKIIFQLSKMMKSPTCSMDCSLVEICDMLNEPNVNDVLNSENAEESYNSLMENEKDESKDDSGTEQTSKELKDLPSNLRYEYLGPKNSLPVIINSSLNDDETKRLLHILRTHKDAIGHSIEDLKGISPSVCMHRIRLKDDVKPSR